MLALGGEAAFCDEKCLRIGQREKCVCCFEVKSGERKWSSNRISQETSGYALLIYALPCLVALLGKSCQRPGKILVGASSCKGENAKDTDMIRLN